jgi:hypothetical protein
MAIIINLTFDPLFTKEIKDGFLVQAGGLGGSGRTFEGGFRSYFQDLHSFEDRHLSEESRSFRR